MSCKCAKQTDEFHGWECEVSGSSCIFIFPDSKKCAELYGEGPDSNYDENKEIQKMNITDVKVRKLFPDDGNNKLLAIISIVIDGDFAVHDIKILKGTERIFVAMPNRRSSDGRFQDIVHPISKEAREYLEETILRRYYAALAETKNESAS